MSFLVIKYNQRDNMPVWKTEDQKDHKIDFQKTPRLDVQ